MIARTAPGWVVLIPVKPLIRGKSRLLPPGPATRRELAFALALDTIAAAVACESVHEVLVVTEDRELAAAAAGAGARALADPGGDLNSVLRQVADSTAQRMPGVRLAALLGDLPSLRPLELAQALAEVGDGQRAFVADHSGTGTTMLAVAGVPLDPRFGPSSAAAHTRSGARPIRLDRIASLRLDVDTTDDLASAVGLGVGPATAGLLRPPATGD